MMELPFKLLSRSPKTDQTRSNKKDGGGFGDGRRVDLVGPADRAVVCDAIPVVGFPCSRGGRQKETKIRVRGCKSVGHPESKQGLALDERRHVAVRHVRIPVGVADGQVEGQERRWQLRRIGGSAADEGYAELGLPLKWLGQADLCQPEGEDQWGRRAGGDRSDQLQGSLDGRGTRWDRDSEHKSQEHDESNRTGKGSVRHGTLLS